MFRLDLGSWGGIIIPIVKDKCGDVSSSSNYCEITLSSNIARDLWQLSGILQPAIWFQEEIWLY